jgi:predicted small secreted protein
VIRAALPAALVAAGLVLTGCSTAETGIGAGTSIALQQEVRHVAQLAAAHRYPAALSAAAALRSDLGAAVDTGRVPTGSATRIRAALDLVEGDLRTAARSASPSPSPSPSKTPTATPARAATPASSPKATATKAAVPKRPAAKPVPRKWWKQHGWKGRGGGDEGD